MDLVKADSAPVHFVEQCFSTLRRHACYRPQSRQMFCLLQLGTRLKQPVAIKLVNYGQGGYGVQKADGKWNGMIGEVAREVSSFQIDLVINLVSIVQFPGGFLR